MMGQKRMFLFLLPFFFGLLSTIFVPGKALAEIESERPADTGNIVSSKLPDPEQYPAILPEPEIISEKQHNISEAAPKTDQRREVVSSMIPDPEQHPAILPETEITSERPHNTSKAIPKTDKRREVVKNHPSQEDLDKKREVEQDIMEKALELLNNSHEFWVSGEIEEALGALDQAYAILLDTNGDPDIARQKDDLRLLISKKILAIYTAKQSVTTGRHSEIPMIMNAEVEREIRSFQTVERDFFISSYQRSLYFRPAIVAALKKAGLPEELSWLPLVESGFKIRALSRARALGLWQFIPSTGYKYGLSRDEWIDERMDVEKSTQAAIGYLKDLHDMFGDWLTDLAAYNCGEGRVLRVISRQHINYLDRFWDLYNQLPNETARYVPRFLATLHIIRDPQKYGMDLNVSVEKQQPYAYEIVKTDKIIKLKDIAARLDVSEEHLVTLNAELRHDKTPDREYRLKIPRDLSAKFAQILDDLPQADRSWAAGRRGAVTIRHKVKYGETLVSIARKYKISTRDIKRQNRSLAKRGLIAGQTLVIRGSSPGPKSSTAKQNEAGRSKVASSRTRYKVKKGDTLFSLASRFDMSVDEIKKMNNIKGSIVRLNQTLTLDKKDAADSGNGKTDSRTAAARVTTARKNRGKTKTYMVKKGDNLIRIAERNGSKIETIMKLNNMTDKDSIQAGQTIVLR